MASVSEALALATLVLAPLPLGSVEPHFVALWCVLLSASLLLTPLPRLDPSALRDAGAAFAVFTAFAGLALWQMSPIGLESGHPAWRAAAEALGRPLQAFPSADPGAGLRDLGQSLLMTLAFVRFRLMAAREAAARRILAAAVAAGAASAIIGAANAFLDPRTLLWREKLDYVGVFTGTFVNRNTAAAFFGSTAIVAGFALISRVRRRISGATSLRDAAFLLRIGFRPGDAVLAAAAALCFVCCAATGSRAGLLLTVVLGLGLFVAYARRRIGAPVLAAAVVAMAVAGIVFSGVVGSRLAARSMVDDLRFPVFEATLGMIAERPLTGHGLGSFETVFPARKPASLAHDGIFDRTHSTPLELASDMGLPILGLLSALWLWFGFRLCRGAVVSPTSIGLCGLGVGALGTLHSMIDFSLQIPGYAVLFAAATAAGLAQGGRRRRRPDAA